MDDWPSKLARMKRRRRAKRLKYLERKKRNKMGFAEIFTALEELAVSSKSDDCEAVVPTNSCKVCGVLDEQKPMCFRGEDWCCDKHRKQILGDSPQKRH